MTARLEGILLAAGESRRMGYPKPLLTIGGSTFLEISARMMLAVTSRVVVVIGAHAEKIRPAIPADQRIVVVENLEYHRGQLSSIKAGIRALASDTGAVLLHLADHPLVRPTTFSRLIDEFERQRAPIMIARSSGRRGHPVIFARSIFDELMAASEDEGARAVVNANPSRVAYLDTGDAGVGIDLDTPADLEKAGLKWPLFDEKEPGGGKL
ncbi:MAG: nucleotidyltransferase family protein [Candidatus Binataceae bacterium]